MHLNKIKDNDSNEATNNWGHAPAFGVRGISVLKEFWGQKLDKR